jgi:cytochrome c biogenesis protein CcdA
MLSLLAPASSQATAFSVVLLGFLLGMRHATDADHVVAVAAIVSRERTIRAAALVGSLWGIGHMLTIVAVGGAIIVFGVVVTPRVGLALELSVAVMLIAVGALTLLRSPERLTTTPRAVHVHPHTARAPAAGAIAWIRRRIGRLGAYQIVRSLAAGVVHGLAGSAAVALLVLATIPDPRWAVAYLVVFGLGTIGGMMLITAALAMPFAFTVDRFARYHRWLGIASGALSVGFGIFLVYKIGVVDGLFTADPQWTPG